LKKIKKLLFSKKKERKLNLIDIIENIFVALLVEKEKLFHDVLNHISDGRNLLSKQQVEFDQLGISVVFCWHE
jgi:hypothetical protein